MSAAQPPTDSSPAAAYSITLGIASRLDQIRMVRAALDGALAHLGVAEEDLHLLSLAVAEILTNRIEHGYGGDEGKRVDVRLLVCGPEVQVEILDTAPPLPQDALRRLTHDLGPIEEPSEEWTMRGHGLQIVRKIVDAISVDSRNGHSCMTLRKTVRINAE